MSKRAIPAASTPSIARIPGGRKLPEVGVTDRGVMVPSTRIEGRRWSWTARASPDRPWRLSATHGRVRTIYHLAARLGLEGVNKPYIDALIAAKLPELLPDAPYKTITVVNLADALWGTRGLALARMERNQHDFPYALFVADEKGFAREAWDLETGQTAVIILDRNGAILFSKEGKLSPAEIRQGRWESSRRSSSRQKARRPPGSNEHRLFTHPFRFHCRHEVCETGCGNTRESRWNLGHIRENHGLLLRLELLGGPVRSVQGGLGPRPGAGWPGAGRLEAPVSPLEASIVWGATAGRAPGLPAPSRSRIRPRRPGSALRDRHQGLIGDNPHLHPAGAAQDGDADSDPGPLGHPKKGHGARAP